MKTVDRLEQPSMERFPFGILPHRREAQAVRFDASPQRASPSQRAASSAK